MPTSDPIKLKNVRLSFPRLYTPRAFRKGQEPRFEATFLLDPSDKQHAEIIEAIEFTANEIVEEHWPRGRPKSLVECFGLAADEKPPLEYDGYEGMYFVRTSANLKNPPRMFDRGRNELVKEGDIEPRIPYAGCYVTASISLWTMDNEFGKRVNANLRLVQFVKDGEAFGAGQASPEDELDILDDEEDDEDFLGD